MKKVICFTESLGAGGAERQLCNLAVLLKQQGYQVEVWTYAKGDFYRYLLDQHDIRFQHLAAAENRWSRIFLLWRQVRKARPDVVIAYMATPSLVMSLVRRFSRGFKLIVSERNTNQSLNWRDKVRFWAYRRADAVVPNAYTQATFIAREAAMLAPKIRVITNYVDTGYFLPATTKRDANNKLQMLVVARVMPQKNVMRFLEALHLVRQAGISFEVKWYGDTTDEAYADRCQMLLTRLGLDAMCSFYPATTDILKAYQEADLFCLPSLYEGFPNVVCEAMSCGLPILCGNVCDNPRLVQDGYNGYLFNPLDVNDMVTAFKKILLLSEQERLIFAKRNRTIAEERFSSTVFVESYKSLF